MLILLYLCIFHLFPLLFSLIFISSAYSVSGKVLTKHKVYSTEHRSGLYGISVVKGTS